MPFIHKISDCPKCGSIATGRYVVTTVEDELNFLRHGELVKACVSIPPNNLFCRDCGFEWFGTSKIIYIDRKMMLYRKKELGIENKNIDEKELEYIEKARANHKTHKIIHIIKKILHYGRKSTKIIFIQPFTSIFGDITKIINDDSKNGGN